MRPPEKPQMDPYFIDRHNYVKTFFHLLEQRNIIQFVADTCSEYGTGKTTVLSTLFYEIEARYPDFKPLWLSLDQFSAHYQNPKLVELSVTRQDERSALIEVQNLIDYHDLLVELSKESLNNTIPFASILETSSLDALRQTLGEQYIVTASAKDNWKQILEDIQAGHIEPSTVRNAVRTTVNHITQKFLSLYNESLPEGKYALLFVDDFCWISDQAIGDWVLNILSQNMQRTWTIIARTTPDLDVQDTSREVKNLYLSNFTPEETATYLHQRLGVKELPPMVVENIYRFTQGHAQKVSMVADLLYNSLENHPSIEMEFPSWNEKTYEDTIPMLLMYLIEDISQPWLRQALLLGTVARRFDVNLLYLALKENYQDALEAGFVEEEEEDDEEQIQKAKEDWCKKQILEAVTRYSFVEQQHDDYSIYYTFQNNMRDVVTQYLSQTQPDPYAAHHQTLANAYSEILSSYEEQDSSQRYVALYRYEDPTWQRMVSEWLYHMSFITDRDEADLEFLRVYFVGFQWWDCFDKFEFCEHILNEWSWTQGKEAQSDAFKKVLRFAEIYPRGFYKHVKGKQPWIEVQQLLGEIADIFHLYDEDDDESSKKQDLRAALTEMYTASYRLSPDPDYDEAERLYQEAIAEAQDEEDPFNESYATAFYADMLLELGRYDEAYEKAEAVNQLMDVEEPYTNERDYEVVTQSYRVMGDVCLFQGRYDEVGHLYSRSAMCGYAQNFALEHDPDPYTLKWYEVNVMLNAQYLVETAQAHSVYEAVETICHDIHATWDSYWKEQPCEIKSADVAKLLKSGDYAQLRLYLAPPTPDPKVVTAEARQEEFNRIVSLFGIPED